jgi:TolB-like protein/tetratricopeptide (TPR) repeat protein
MGVLTELKRRNVFRVGIAYAAVGWIVVEVTDTVAPAMSLPDWTLTAVIWFGIIGFPFALLFAWAFEITPEGLKRTQDVEPDDSPARFTAKKLEIGIIAVLMVLVGVLVLDTYVWKERAPKTGLGNTADTVTNSSHERTVLERPAQAREALPSIAVLPFENMGGDPEQEYFANGITEDLTTDLSKVSGLFVIARNSAFKYKGIAVEPAQVAEELGVSHIIEGSVRREDNDLRINVQLIDAVTGGQLWADRYDGSLNDIFLLQDLVTKEVISALSVSLTGSEMENLGEVPETLMPLAYDAVLKGWEHLRRRTQEDSERAIDYFKEAIELDSDYSRAYAGLAAAYWSTVSSGWEFAIGKDWAQNYAMAITNLEKALESPTALAYSISAEILVQQGNYREALSEINRALALNQNDPDVHISKARLLNAIGRAEDAENGVRTAMRLNPHYEAEYLRTLGRSLFHQQRYQEAADALERVVNWQRDVIDDFATLASAYGHLGQVEDAHSAIKGYNRLAAKIDYTPINVQEIGFWWYGDIFDYDHAYRIRLLEGLRKAGVPEGAESQDAIGTYRSIITHQRDGTYDVEGTIKIDAVAAKNLLDRGALVVDVRDAGSFARGHIPGAVHLELNTQLTEKSLLNLIEKQDAVLFHCWGKYCPYSAWACAKAAVWGFDNAYHFEDGFPGWRDAGFRVDSK